MKSLTKQKKGIKFKINIILTRKLLKKINLLMICGIGITLLMVKVCVGVLKWEVPILVREKGLSLLIEKLEM